jgi:serine/threonine-protein kinase
MGTVYVGVDETLDRRVALKVIRAEHRFKPSGKARFLREAKILSRLDNPGICKLYDFIEGDDEDCLVLELLEGTSLLRAMTDNEWTMEQKLEIARKLLDVLVVVHGEGIIHRDLTPLNVMITPSSDVKVLDFGLARVADPEIAGDDPPPSGPPATEADRGDLQRGPQTLVIGDESAADEQRGTAASNNLETRQGAILGTTAFMSPEQARGDAVTAASDMYSYGLIIQQLFTGRPPYPPHLDQRELRRRSLLAETEPVAGLPTDLTALIHRLTSFQPASRPSSVDASAMLQSIIDRPVRRRRRRLVAAVWLVLAVFGAGMSVQYLRAERESARAERHAARAEAEATAAHQVSEFLVGLFEVSDPGRGDATEVTARELLDAGASRIDAELAEQPVAHARLTHTMGVVYHHLGDLDRASQMLTAALKEREDALGANHPDVADTLFELGLVNRYLGEYGRAFEIFNRGLTLVTAISGTDGLESARFLHQLAIIDEYRGNLDGADARLEQALALYESDPLANAEGIAEVLSSLAGILVAREQFEEAEPLLRRALALDTEVHGSDSLEAAGALSSLGNILVRTGRFDEAEQAMQRSLAIQEERLGPNHPFTAGAINGVAHFYYSQGRYEESIELLGRAHRIYLTAYGTDHLHTATALSNLGMVVAKTGDLAEAERLLTESLAIMNSAVGPTHPRIASTAYQLAGLKVKLDKTAEADELYRRALAIQEEVFGPDSPPAQASRERLAAL